MNTIFNTLSHPKNAIRGSTTAWLLPVFFLMTAVILNSGTAVAEPGADPRSLGMGNARMAQGGGNNAAVLNPAILGAQIEPWGSAQLFPLVGSVTAGYWSDKLALTPYREFFSIDKDGQWQEIVAQILNESFRVAGETPEETSRKITRKIAGGTSIYSAAGISLLEITLGRIAVDVRTSVDTRVDLPEAPFLMLFSEDKGLKPGADLSLTHLGAQAAAVTDINLGYGQPIDLSRIAEVLNGLTKSFTDFKYASWGLGATVSLGQGFLDLTTSKGGVHYANDGSKIVMDVDATLLTSGIGLHDNYAFGNPYEDGFSLAGWGAGINAGLLMYGEHTSLSLAIRRLGPMIWTNVRKGDVHYRTSDLTLAGLFDEKDIDIFDADKGGTQLDEHDSLSSIGNLVRWQPTRLNLGFGYRFDFRNREKQGLRALSEFLNTSIEYEQSLAPWPDRSFVPRVALGAENGFLWGSLPVRAGFVFGGAEKIASTAGFSLGTRVFCFQVGYEAIGTPYWYPKRGFEVAAGFSTEWKRFRDPDRDGISNKTDRCPYTAEDVDGFEDADGCPDFDNDNDAIPDSLDKCQNALEDKDGFQDADGCPDPDNDKDGFPDTLDKCPNAPEDRDGFEDADGCPDLDNDSDGVPDSIDRCINMPEDRDGVEDGDGCPDIDVDTDSDGFFDSLDRCPAIAEVFNFVNDDDGCPDSAVRFTPEQKSKLDTLLMSIRFTKAGKLEVRSIKALDSLGVLLNAVPSQHYLLCWADSTLSDSICTSRADTIVLLLTARGIERSRIAVPVSGCTAYCSQCGGKAGGVLYVKVIETVAEFRSIAVKQSQPADSGANGGNQPTPPGKAEEAPVKQ